MCEITLSQVLFTPKIATSFPNTPSSLSSLLLCRLVVYNVLCFLTQRKFLLSFSSFLPFCLIYDLWLGNFKMSSFILKITQKIKDDFSIGFIKKVS